MKITRESEEFKPVTIVLETEEEAGHLLNLLELAKGNVVIASYEGCFANEIIELLEEFTR